MSYPTTLAAFRRFLIDGGAITLRGFSYDGETQNAHKYRDVTRTSQVVQTERVKLTPGESWLTFGPAADWTFDGATATVHGEHGPLMVYEMGEPT
jgi:hypothetical protein